MTRPPPTSTLFPYTTLFRSCRALHRAELSVLSRSVQGILGPARPDLFKTLTPAVPARVLRFRPVTEIVKRDRKSTRLNSSHSQISYAVFCLKKKNKSLRPR